MRDDERTEYIAGLWLFLTAAARNLRAGRRDQAVRRLRWYRGYFAGLVRDRNWRAVRNTLVKPYRCESVSDAPRVGWGWTPSGARRHLDRIEASTS